MWKCIFSPWNMGYFPWPGYIDFSGGYPQPRRRPQPLGTRGSFGGWRLIPTECRPRRRPSHCSVCWECGNGNTKGQGDIGLYPFIFLQMWLYTSWISLSILSAMSWDMKQMCLMCVLLCIVILASCSYFLSASIWCRLANFHKFSKWAIFTSGTTSDQTSSIPVGFKPIKHRFLTKIHQIYDIIYIYIYSNISYQFIIYLYIYI